MSQTTSTATDVAALPRDSLRRVVTVLSVTEITSWGVLYYALPVLAPTISADTGWSPPAILGAFSAGLVVSAVLGIVVGGIIDRHGPRAVMTAGSVLTIPAVGLVALAPTYPVFLAGWLLVGIAMAGTLYPPAVVALTHWAGPRRVAALTTLTLVAGLASTVFAPLTAVLAGELGWRSTYLVLLAVLAAITIPLHWWGLHQPWTRHAETTRLGDSAPNRRDRVWTTRPFLLLALSTSAVGFSVYAVVVNLVPLLISRGLTTGQAALALGLGGIGQVLGRLGYARLVAGTTTLGRTAGVFAGIAATTGLLAVLPGPILALMAASMLAGVGRGIFTLLQSTAVSDRWGVRGFGRLHGILTAPLLLASAVAPFAGAATAAATGSQTNAFLILTLIAAAAAAIALGTHPTQKGTNP